MQDTLEPGTDQADEEAEERRLSEMGETRIGGSLKYWTIYCYCQECGKENSFQARRGSRLKDEECWNCHKVGTLKMKPRPEVEKP
jgi:hypothetical protein